MKNKKVKSLLCLMIAFAIAIPGITIALSNNVEPVSALNSEEVEPDQTETPEETEQSEEAGTSEQSESSEEPKESTEEALTESQTQDETPSQTSETTPSNEETPSEEKSTPAAPSIREILSALKNTFKDAIKDLIAHFKKWLKRS